MDIKIEKLTPDRVEDYIYYFDHVAFTDHEEWANCYCLESHLSQEENEAMWTEKDHRREKARELIMKGIMQGYLVYDGDDVIGWCNAGDKTGYEPLMSNSIFETKKVGRIIRDAEEEGYSYVEGYPFRDRKFEHQYHGPIPLYEKHGFQMFAERDWVCIMQKSLQG